jgi:cephalosporin-C deacetylase
MPQVDKPLAELLQYQGTNPKPHDFEAFWDQGLAEMKAIDPQIELRPSKEIQSSVAEAFDLYFTGVGGARVHAKYLRPKGKKEPHPAVLQFHGYSWHSGEWHEKLNYVSEGFSVAALDCRGQGGFSEDVGGVKGPTLIGHVTRGLDHSPEKLLFRQIFLDTAQLARIVMSFPEVDEKRVGAMGGSQGGALTLVCAALEPRIKKAAPVFPFLCDYRRVWDMDLAKDAYDDIKKFFRFYDPQHLREEEIFTRLGYIDVQFLAPRIKAEILMGTGLMDAVCPPSTQFAAYNKITSKKEVKVYPDFGHEGLPGFTDSTFNFLASL